MEIPLNHFYFLFEEPTINYILNGIAIFTSLLTFLLLSYISFFESEFFSLSVKEMAEVKLSNDKKFNKLKNLSENPLDALGSVIVSRYTCIAIAITLSVLLLHKSLTTTFTSWSSALIIVIIELLLLFIFTEFIPEKMVKKENPSFLCTGARIVTVFGTIFHPVVRLLISSTGVVDRRLESRTQRSAAIDDISDTLNMSGVESLDEKEMLRGVVNFGKTTVDEIMQPRVDIVDIDFKSDFETVLKVIRESEYSRLPVYDESIDYVKGILYIKDFLQYTDQKEDFKWQNFIREAYFVPENKKIDDLLKEFQQKHIHMAIVVDEFGGTSGIVTMEDIIEVIVGDICDEHDEEEMQITAIDDHTYLLDGKLLLSDFYRIENVEKEAFEQIEGDADTLAGLILEVKGYIPTKGEEIIVEKYCFEIVSDDKRRIKEVKLTIKD